MGKVCAVKNCDSGRKKSSSKKNVPLLSFFQATESSRRLEKWTKCLGISLKNSDYICQLHFKDEDVKSYDNIIIDGKKSLQQHAVPINVNSQLNQMYFNDSEEYQQPQQQQISNTRKKGMQQAFVEERNYNDSMDSQESIKDFIDQMKNVSILLEFWSFSNKQNKLQFMRVEFLCKRYDV